MSDWAQQKLAEGVEDARRGLAIAESNENYEVKTGALSCSLEHLIGRVEMILRAEAERAQRELAEVE